MSRKKLQDKANIKVLAAAKKAGIDTVWDRFEAQQPQCGFGMLGICCRMCNMGPCRIDPFGEGPSKGACGATADTIAARDMARATAAGSASHSDHARDLALTLIALGKGQTQGYSIRDPIKLKIIAGEFGIDIKDKKEIDIARQLGEKVLEEFGKQEGELILTKRAPKKQQDIWRSMNITPRGIDREVVETLSRTHEGMDQDYKNLVQTTMRVALADGWGGSMIATELSDILFGSPQPIRARANLGVLKEDEVNIIIHGHEPTLSDVIVTAAQDKELLELAKSEGAKGINVAGICCTANEILVRRGLPVAGNFLQQELAILTGAIELMVVDIQCIMPGVAQAAKHFHTKVISTSPKAAIPGVEGIAFHEDKALDTAKEIIKLAVENYKRRDRSRVNIPKESMELVAGFTAENIFYHLGGRFRGSYKPLNENIINGRIRGVAGVVGCDNPKMGSGAYHVALVKELIKNDCLVVQTGCAAIECGKEGLLRPETAYEMAGDGLKEVCKAVGIPPVLHAGSCVDNTRILIACCEMVKEGGIGTSLDELPIAGAALEWMAEKAMAIGWYFVASGALVVFGTPMRVTGSQALTDYITKDLEQTVGGKWAFIENPIDAAHAMLAHIDKKRKALKLQPMLNKQAFPVGV
ncbi:MAG: carbon-monoxide dehydrogenase catalytic subunit [Omnitrophica bacterium RIFCSPLOWO2_01_FULL_45_10]|nr:MAG: carbon-monoxide dehydrogenase catalytic subunit [Omnitrophica bacterium RIFCSPLOWO2_01_FULL_45_10]